MIWTRERYISHCLGEYTGREMFCELFGPLVGLEEEWRKQGATQKEIELTAFDFDYVPHMFISARGGCISGIKEKILEENADIKIITDKYGRKCKLCKQSATIPLPLEFPVETMDDWLKIKHWYEFSEDRIDYEKIAQQKKMRDEQGYLTLYGFPGGFDELRELMGEVNLCIAYYEEPELVKDILDTMTDTQLKILDRISGKITIDNLFIHEDMAGKSGSLIGPMQIDEFVYPYYSKVWDAAKSCGARLFSQDSDGNMNSVIDSFLKCGVMCFLPAEPAAGMDIVQLRKKYGNKMYFKGGIDKHALRKDKDAILKELTYKMSDIMKGGGTIFALDHRIPNGVSIENYRYYVETGRELLGLPPISEEGWMRMAF